MDLLALYQHINTQHFEGLLEAPELRWNSRLRSSAGRFIPGARSRVRKISPWLRFGIRRQEDVRKPVIEVASYLRALPEGEHHVRETIAHEMIHYWLWMRRRPFGHTPEFYEKMRSMGGRRYNPVPVKKTPKYMYRCGSCAKEFPAQRKLGPLACAVCCKAHAGGKYDPRFALYLDQVLR